jgi:hypothetical protein
MTIHCEQESEHYPRCEDSGQIAPPLAVRPLSI